MKHEEPKKIEDMIDFNDEHVNKRIITENGEQKAILFALKKEQEIPLHTSPVDAFICVIEGEIDFILYPEEECGCTGGTCGLHAPEDNSVEAYVVKKGETILDIAKMHKTTVEKLAKSNKKIRELTLPVGTVLLIDKAK